MDNETDVQMTMDYDYEEDGSMDNLYLTFHLGGEEYGIEIAYVIEIAGMQEITRIPRVPDFVKGVINLRGQVIPVIDVRTRFGLEFLEYNERTCAIVVKINNLTIGMLVDAVDEVINIPETQTSLPQAVAMSDSGRFVRGLGRINKKVIILLELSRIFSGDEIEALSGVASQ